MFPDAEIAEVYALDCHAHDLNAEQQCLDAGLGVSMHTITRVTTPAPDRLLPWDPGDAWLVEEAIRATKAEAAAEPSVGEPGAETLPLFMGV